MSVTSPVMVGREPESARLSAALTALADGQGQLVVISGEAGIGKTRLVDEVLGRADERVRTVRAECLALGSGIPYLPFAELLRDLQRQLTPSVLARLVGPARTELARFLPEVAVMLDTELDAGAAHAGATERSDETERLRLYEAFLRVAERIADDAPTAFVVEDVQWIDQASLELLAFLAHGLRQTSGATLIISVRPEEVEDKERLLTLLAELGRGGDALRIELGPLSPEATRHLTRAILGQAPDDVLTDHVQRLSDGNPLFAEELLASWLRRGPDESLPPKLRDLLAARLAQVPQDVMPVLRVAAEAGRIIDDRLLTRASGLSEDQVQRAVRYAVDDYILVRSDRPPRPGYRFRHEMLRALVASQLLPEEARRIHAAYARALAEEPPERRSATEIANHWDAAGETARALAAHVEAGRVAASTFAFGAASDHDERALQLWDRVEDAEASAGEPRTVLLRDAAAAAARVGRFERAIELTRELMTHRDALDVDTYELARSSLPWYLWESGDLEAGLAEAVAVVEDAAPLPGRWRANALAHTAALLLYLQRTDEAHARAEQAREMAMGAEAVAEQILAEGVLGWCLLLEGEVDAGLEAIRRALDAARSVEGHQLEGRYPVGLALAHSQLAVALELVGRLEEAHAVAVRGIESAARQGVARTFGSLLQASAVRALYQLGRWDEARTAAQDALDAGAVGSGRISLLALRALLAVGRGETTEAEAVLAEAESLIGSSTPIDVRRWHTAAAAEHAIWQGDPAAALTRMAFAVGDMDTPPVAAPGAQPTVLDASIPYLLALAGRATADVALAERAAGVEPALSAMAAEQLRSALRRAERRRALADAWAGDLAVARAELDRGANADPATRIRRWKSALERVSNRPYLRAYARWRLAESQLARREGREDAAESIGTALATTETLHAARLQAELIGLAQRARLAVSSTSEGTRVSTTEGERPFGLTERELEVLALVAAGLSNQDIAERLFISPKTASVHVSNIYGKLGVESRVAAATMAHELGLALPREALDEP